MGNSCQRCRNRQAEDDEETDKSTPVNVALSMIGDKTEDVFEKYMQHTKAPLLEALPVKPFSRAELRAFPGSKAESDFASLLNDPSCDTEAVHKAISRLKRKTTTEREFLEILAKYPRANELYSHLTLVCTGRYSSILKLNLLASRFFDAGLAGIRVAFSQNKVSKKIKALDLAQTIFQLHTRDKFYAKAVVGHMKLLEEQQRLEKELGLAVFVDCSLVETIDNLIRIQAKEPEALLMARRVSRMFGLSNKRFWYIMVKAMADTSQWAALCTMVKNCPPPMGYAFIIKTLVRGGKHSYASQLLRRVTVTDKEEIKEIQEVLGVSNLDDVSHGIYKPPLVEKPSVSSPLSRQIDIKSKIMAHDVPERSRSSKRESRRKSVERTKVHKSHTGQESDIAENSQLVV